MTKMKIDRLQTLATFLRGLKPRLFYIGYWVDISDEQMEHHVSKKGEMRKFTPEDAKECGFAACAGGWAGSIPEFRKHGLSLRVRSDTLFPVYKKEWGYPALERFFGLTDTQAEHLFSPMQYERAGFELRKVTPKMVAKRIEHLIKKQEAQT